MGKYRNPPIVEAIIDITFNSGCSIDETIINKYHEKIKDVFPKKEPLFGPNISINLSKAKEAKISFENKIKSYKFLSNDSNVILQLIDNRFVFSKLDRPYPGWDEFIMEMWEKWNEFASITNPISIGRIGLRFINKILCDKTQLDGFMNIKSLIALPEKRAIGITNAIQRFNILETEKRESGIINLVINPQEKQIEIIFDIDVFELEEISNDKDLILEKLESLRKFKNEIFESNITDKAREAFQ